MLKMIIRMDDNKINIEKNTVWVEYTEQLTVPSSKWGSRAWRIHQVL